GSRHEEFIRDTDVSAARRSHERRAVSFASLPCGHIRQERDIRARGVRRHSRTMDRETRGGGDAWDRDERATGTVAASRRRFLGMLLALPFALAGAARFGFVSEAAA